MVAALDSSGNARHGTYQGAPLFARDPVITAGRSVELGDGAWADLGAILPTTSALTFELWLNLAAAPSTDRLLVGHTAAAVWQFRLLLMVDGTVRWDARDTGGSQARASSAVLTTGVRHHLVAVADTDGGGQARARLWVDNVLVDTGTQPNPLAVVDTALSFGVARRDSTHLGLGAGIRVDELAIYDFVLSEARIAAHFQAGTTVPTGVLHEQERDVAVLAAVTHAEIARLTDLLAVLVVAAVSSEDKKRRISPLLVGSYQPARAVDGSYGPVVTLG